MDLTGSGYSNVLLSPRENAEVYVTKSVCIQKKITQRVERFLTEFCRSVGHGPMRKKLDFGGNLESSVDRGSLSRILYH